MISYPRLLFWFYELFMRIIIFCIPLFPTLIFRFITGYSPWLPLAPLPGEGGTQQSFIRGDSAPRSKLPVLFYKPFLTEKVSLSHTFHRKQYSFHIPTVETLHPYTLEMNLMNDIPGKHQASPVEMYESAVRCVCSRYLERHFSIPK